MARSVLLFEFLDYCEFGVGFKAMAWTLEVLTDVYATRLFRIVSVLVHSDVHGPFTFAYILDSADGAFYKVDDPLAFAVEFMEDVVGLVGPIALESCGSSDLFATLVFPFG